MDIKQAIEVLEAAGFHLYRRLRRGDELCGALMVHTRTDLYVGIRLIDNELWSHLSGDCPAQDSGLFLSFLELWEKIPGLLAQAQKQRDTLSEYYGKQDAELDMRIPIQLQELKAQTGRALEPCWLAENGLFKGVYRGVILEINESLRVIGFDDYVLRSDAATSGSGLPLEEVFDQIDAAGGYEEERIEGPCDAETPQYQAAVH
jgi:hypothetical protein